jgi:hypothetical protein
MIDTVQPTIIFKNIAQGNIHHSIVSLTPIIGWPAFGQSISLNKNWQK